MRRSAAYLLIATLIPYVLCQDLDALINQVYNNNGTQTNNNNNNNNANGGDDNVDLTPNREGGIDGTGNCECVPYYQCNNNTINTNGVGLIDIRIQDGPCTDYLQICCNKPEIVDEKLTPPPPIVKPTGCGRRNPDGVGFRIKGDTDNEAQFGEFPWMVAILREEIVEGNPNKLNVYQCGGALIHPQVVLTAAHCVQGKDKKFKVRAGEWDTQTTNELYAHQDRNVKKVVSHAQFYSGALFNDVALLILETEFEIIDNVDVVCLPPVNVILDRARCFASGWGKDVYGKEGKYQVILKKVELPIVGHADCQTAMRTTRLGKHFELHRSFICAGGEPGKDTCKGDGGSPLVCPIKGHSDRYFQAGIVAWGIGCGEKQIPGVYANVPLFKPWIDEHMTAEGFDHSSYTY